MAKLIYSERAIKDLKEITNYTERAWSEEKAIRYYNSLLDACEYIVSAYGAVGIPYDHIRSGLFGFHSGKHMIFYRLLSKKSVRIVRILHEKMDYDSHL